MRCKWLMLFVVVACPVMANAQGEAGGNRPPYQPVVPAPTVVANGYSGGPAYYGASTAAGSAMNGMANVISAQGQRNLSNSAAAVNWTQAQKNEIENYSQWTNTYFQTREANRAYREQERGPRTTPEQMVRFAQQGKPKPLPPSALNPDGRINWPILLATETFADNRATVDSQFLKRAERGGIGFDDQMAANTAITAMTSQLKELIREVPTPDYVSAKEFLKSLAYAVQYAP
jgi:hypothetical protein